MSTGSCIQNATLRAAYAYRLRHDGLDHESPLEFRDRLDQELDDEAIVAGMNKRYAQIFIRNKSYIMDMDAPVWPQDDNKTVKHVLFMSRMCFIHMTTDVPMCMQPGNEEKVALERHLKSEKARQEREHKYDKFKFDPEGSKREFYEDLSEEISARYRCQSIETRAKGRPSCAKLWLRSPNRRVEHDVIFNPKLKPGLYRNTSGWSSIKVEDRIAGAR